MKNIFLIVSLMALTSVQAILCQNISPSFYFPHEESRQAQLQGMDAEIALSLFQKLKAEDYKLHSLLIVQNDSLVQEYYKPPYKRNTLHNVKSVSKSIYSILAGIAQEEGYIGSLQSPIKEFLPDYAELFDSAKSEISLYNLLTMTAGIRVDENSMQSIVVGSPNWVQTILEHEMLFAPGEDFLYNTFMTHLLSACLEEATQKDMAAFSEQHLFSELGISDYAWEQDPQGIYVGGHGLWLRPIDLAKIGVLAKNKGQWNGKQLVPKSWMDESTTAKTPTNFENTDYGYYWWLLPDNWVAAYGAHGQLILYNQELNTVIAATGAENTLTRQLANDYLIPMVSASNGDQDVKDSTLHLMAELSKAEKSTVQIPEKIIQAINHHKFTLQPNPFVQSLEFEFAEKAQTFKLWVDLHDPQFALQGSYGNQYAINPIGDAGLKPGENFLAIQGRWLTDSEFLLTLHELGYPGYLYLTFDFSKLYNMIVKMQLMPVGMEFELPVSVE